LVAPRNAIEFGVHHGAEGRAIEEPELALLDDVPARPVDAQMVGVLVQPAVTVLGALRMDLDRAGDVRPHPRDLDVLGVADFTPITTGRPERIRRFQPSTRRRRPVGVERVALPPSATTESQPG